ncbi:MAG: D-glycero-beta-D-manno-heptose 1-phosphate adenylyltransferase [Candidatus Omnitrophica bacterium]|nr:D-glycero-beta-D-manno-heptose 1-phosphate adenylyltransferase [Candidatus Omnitrophota bacterium]
MRTRRTGFFSGLKVKTLKELNTIIKNLKSKGKKIVFTNGCFDLLHYGHLKYLEEAKAKGDILVVAINSDTSVNKIKGDKRPITSEKDRARIIAGLACVDYVVVFKEETPLNVIKILKPDILVKGRDWKADNIVGREVVLKNGGRVSTLSFLKGYSTTNLIKKIAEKF